LEPALTQQLISLAHTQVYSEEADTPDDWESAYDDEGNRLQPPPPVEPCVSQGVSLVPATPPPPPAVASAVEPSEQNTALLIVEPPRHARLRKHRRLRHRLEYKRVGWMDGSCEHSRLRRDMFSEPEVEPPPQPPRPYDDEFLSPRPPSIYNPGVYTESANKLDQLGWRQLGRKLDLPPCGATTKQKRDALRAAAATDAHLGVEERVDERDSADYGLRGRADDDAYFAVQKYDNVFGDTIMASRRQSCATPSLAKLSFGSLVSQRPVSPQSLLELSLEASKPAPRHEQASKLHVESAVPAATEPPVTKSSATELAAALAAEPVSAVFKPSAPEPAAAALAAAVSAASDPSPAEPVSAAVKPSASEPVSAVIKPSATVESMDELATTPHHVQLAATRIQACYRGMLARGKARWDPVWVVVWPESSTRREGKTLMVPDDAVEMQFHYYHARLHHVFEFLIERLGMGSEATHVLRSIAGRTLSDLGQTLYEANLRRCIEGVRGCGGFYLELCPIGLVSKKAKPAVDAICEHAHRESIAATRIQSRWRGVLGRDNYQAAKQAKAKKERRAKRAAAKREATAVQLASDEKLQSATTPTSPSEPPAEEPTADSVDELAATPSQYAMVVEESRELAAELAVAASSEEEVADIGAALEVDLGTTPGDLERLAMAESEDEAALRTGGERSLALGVESSGVAAPKPTLSLASNTPLWEAIGWRMVNKEPRVGGMCMIVALLESPIAKEDFLHRLLDHLEHDADAANTVASYHEFAEEEIKTFELKSLRHAVRRVLGVSDVATCVAQLREPIGYRHGARLVAPLPVAVLFAAASYMKLDIVVLDARTATPLYAIVRCPRSHPVLLHTCSC
jgi:hypothetical protein